MPESTSLAAPAATLFSPEELLLLAPLAPLLHQVAALLASFRANPLTPAATASFELRLATLLRQMGLQIVDRTFNSLEPDDKERMPRDARFDRTRYRLRRKTPWTFSCLFGSFRLRSWLYEPREPGEACVHPLERLLGMVGRKATPALAGKVGQLSAQHTQQGVLDILHQEHDVCWSDEALRRVSAEVAVALGQRRPEAQAQRLLDLLRRASGGHGRLPVLAVGRDGIMVPVIGEKYREASVATLSVYGRQGKRLGAVYLGVMPEAGQQTLTDQLTWLIKEVLSRWTDRRLRLVYVTDAGNHSQDYYRGVLKRMGDPAHRGKQLAWEWVVDYYHATGYVTLMAEGLFGETEQARRWAQRMRRLLKEPGGAKRVLQAASYQRKRQEMGGQQREKFWKGYGYISRYLPQMDYARCRRLKLPMGSGVTEAGCKVTVTQRLKQSGMRWSIQGGQLVMNLRVAWLSDIWATCWESHLHRKSLALSHTCEAFQLVALQNHPFQGAGDSRSLRP